MQKVFHPLGLIVTIPSLWGAYIFWKEQFSNYPSLAFILTSVVSGCITLQLDRFIRSPKFQTTLKTLLLRITLLGRPKTYGRSHYIYGFLRLKENEQPPSPKYISTSSAIATFPPWTRSVPLGCGTLWVSIAFAYVPHGQKKYDTLDTAIESVWGEQYSEDAINWHTNDRQQKDNFVRYRRKLDGKLSNAISLDGSASVLGDSH